MIKTSPHPNPNKSSISQRVLLVRPPAPNVLSFTKILDNEPLELEYLAASLKEGDHDYLIFDGLITPTAFETTLISYQPHVVAITGYITQERLMLDYCQVVKAYNPETTTILGGVHVQLNYHRLMADVVDYMCRSEDVRVFSDLVKSFQVGTLDSLSTLSGLVYRDPNRAWVINPLKPFSINHLPLPDRSFFHAHKDHYRYLDLKPVATLKTAFSCPHTCNFCYCTQLAGGSYQTRDLDLVLAEIEGIDAPNIQIVDDTFIVNPKRVTQFLDGLEARGIQKTFICYARADDITRHPDLVARMSALGFRYFLVGLEAIDTHQLDQYNKKTTADVNRRCAEIMSRLEPKSYLIGLMIVSHEATAKDFDRLYEWVVENRIHHVTVSIFTPIPGTPLYEAYKDKITSDNSLDWDFLHLVLEPTNMSRSAFYRAYYKLFMRLYRIAKKTGIYSFMDLDYYRILLGTYLKRQFTKPHLPRH